MASTAPSAAASPHTNGRADAAFSIPLSAATSPLKTATTPAGISKGAPWTVRAAVGLPQFGLPQFGLPQLECPAVLVARRIRLAPRLSRADITHMAGDPPDRALTRRDFFTKGLTRALGAAADSLAARVSPAGLIRPPGSLPEPAFLAACTRCGDCVSVCPVGAISLFRDLPGFAAGTPVLHPALTACVMCVDIPCARACPTGALAVPETGWAGLRLASLDIDTERCITYRDVECSVCARVCPVGADALAIDSLGHPRLGSACTGCGVCVAACVTSPSSIHPT
jgi:ferredoxin-type protein NapG